MAKKAYIGIKTPVTSGLTAEDVAVFGSGEYADMRPSKVQGQYVFKNDSGEGTLYSDAITLINTTLPDALSGSSSGTFYLVPSNYSDRYFTVVYSGLSTSTPSISITVTGGTVIKPVARKVKKIYLGILTDIPIYEEQTHTVNITADNISTMFNVTNGSRYYFAGSGDTFTTNNGGVNSSTATTTLTAKKDMTVSFNYSYSSEEDYDKFTLKVAGTTVENAVSGATTSKSYSGSLAAGQTIEFTYAKDSSQNKNDDKCTFSAMEVTATEQTQTGTETKSVARKVKKTYIGIGGVARPCFGDGLKYYGTITPLSAARKSFAATTVGSYALFGGGYPYTTTVEVYNKSLVKSTADELTGSNRENLAATTVGNYALFAGGGNNSWSLATVEAYNTSLVKSTPDALSAGKQDLAATTVGNYALFGGGHYNDNSNRYGTVDAYNTSLVKSTPDALSTVKYYTAATTVGNYALFGGGIYGENRNYLTNTVDAYNTSLVKSTPDVLSVARRCLVATTVGNYALFAGGNGSGSSSFFATVDAYNASLVKSTPDALSTAKQLIATTTVGDYALFAGGDGTDGFSDAVDAYNTSLVKSTPNVLSVARHSFVATTVGNYALFAGGVLESGNHSSAVDVYTA